MNEAFRLWKLRYTRRSIFGTAPESVRPAYVYALYYTENWHDKKYHFASF